MMKDWRDRMGTAGEWQLGREAVEPRLMHTVNEHAANCIAHRRREWDEPVNHRHHYRRTKYAKSFPVFISKVVLYGFPATIAMYLHLFGGSNLH